ncbi:MAG TPA: hypothetical protein VFZ44_11565 [Pyrinomonadaceae bacterium]
MSPNYLSVRLRPRIARAAAGVLVLAAAAFAQYKLAKVPRPVNLETAGNFSPLTVRLGQEELIVEGPSVNAEDGLLFSHDGKADEIVDVSFDRARLDGETVEIIESEGLKPPTSLARIDYRAQEPEKPPVGDESCRTRVELRAVSKMPDAIHLYQLDAPGLDRYRQLELRAEGAELASLVLTASPSGSAMEPGCQKLLTVGDWAQPFTTDVGFVVAENSHLRFSFKPLTAGTSLWGDAEGFFEPFDLGAQQLSPTDLPPFQARAVSVRRLGGDAPSDAPVLLSARSIDDGAPLKIYGLKIGSNQLQLGVAGKGWVKVNGEDVADDILKRAEENPILAALLATANTALLAWVARLIFKSPSPERPRTRESERGGRPKRRRRGGTRR